MLGAFEIEGFRGIRSLRVPRLARINLFVGTNITVRHGIEVRG